MVSSSSISSKVESRLNTSYLLLSIALLTNSLMGHVESFILSIPTVLTSQRRPLVLVDKKEIQFGVDDFAISRDLFRQHDDYVSFRKNRFPFGIVKSNDKDTRVENEFKKHGMPWKDSIDPTYSHPHLFYMPFWEFQKEFMEQHLTNLRPIPVTSRDGTKDLSYIEKTGDGVKSKVRMSTIQFTCDEFRKIRMTVYDAGNQTQVFTSLWYPQPHLGNLPVFGTDLLQFNRKRHLCVVDLQPLTKKSDHSRNYNDGNDVDFFSSFDYENEILKPIRDQYPSLQETMTKRFYDENQFFSKQMLLGRFEKNENTKASESKSNYDHAYGLVQNELMPAYQKYLQSYLKMVQSATKMNQQHLTNTMIQRQRDYDNYSAQRDPAHAMFKNQFGEEFADDYVHDVLFSFSDREENNDDDN